MTLLWDNSLAAFVALDLVLGGVAAWLAGRALALGWRRVWQVVAYMCLLGGAVRFFHYALAGGALFTPYYYLVDTAVLTAIALLSYRFMRAGQMTNQYPWLYRRTSPITWTARQD